MAGWVSKRFELALNGNAETEIITWMREQRDAGYGSYPNISQVTSRGHERWITITLNNGYTVNGIDYQVKLFRIYPHAGLADFLTWLNGYTETTSTMVNPVAYSIENGHAYIVGVVVENAGVVDGTWYGIMAEVGQNPSGMAEIATWLEDFDSSQGFWAINTFDNGTLNFTVVLSVR